MSATSVVDWWTQAACAGYDPEWWSDDLAGRRAAVRICATCPVRAACLEDARRQGDLGVVRGGALLMRSRHGLRVTLLFCERCGEAPLPGAGTRAARWYPHTCRTDRVAA